MKIVKNKIIVSIFKELRVVPSNKTNQITFTSFIYLGSSCFTHSIYATEVEKNIYINRQVRNYVVSRQIIVEKVSSAQHFADIILDQ